jgi:hypothetical protein
MTRNGHQAPEGRRQRGKQCFDGRSRILRDFPGLWFTTPHFYAGLFPAFKTVLTATS